MGFSTNTFLAAGSKVRVAGLMEVPDWSKWDDDRGRTSSMLKKRLQSMFFHGDRKVSAEIIYIARQSVREQLRRKGQVKVRIRDASGSSLIITADPAKLVKVA